MSETWLDRLEQALRREAPEPERLREAARIAATWRREDPHSIDLTEDGELETLRTHLERGGFPSAALALEAVAVQRALAVARRRFPGSPVHAEPAPLAETPAPEPLQDRVAFPFWLAVQALGVLVLVVGLILAAL
ncbi:MAG: hypothetical protein H6741_07320 [Alphaproteobacteria bacterium]|nr:hypothetical protein [Alphaproteobacteria bacterium]